MQYKGINYDVGTRHQGGISTREIFDSSIAQKEIEIIKNDLHCNAIRISGDDTSRLILASQIALDLGMTVWLSPVMIDHSQEDFLDLLGVCAQEAELLRQRYGSIHLVVGCESSLFISGIVAGNTFHERLRRLFSPLALAKSVLHLDWKFRKDLGAYLIRLVKQARQHFGGKLTYASGTWERVNWDLFDFVGIDHYRASFNKHTYRRQLAGYRKFKKPIVVLEFGCCTYQGADDKGPMGWAIINWEGERPQLTGPYVRDEQVQAAHLGEILEILQQEDVSGAFIFTFVNPLYAHDENPIYDLDMASYAVVTPVIDPGRGNYKGLPWIPKKAFHEIARYYSQP